jgi:Flp pilus assembly pilin Flp
MKKLLSKTFGRFRRSEDGATLVEYGAALAVVLIVAVTALSDLGNQVLQNFQTASSNITP